MLKKRLLILAGTLSGALGAVGLFLPLLPTTPFLLLAAYCYLRSSQALYDRLMRSRVLGSYLHNYLRYRAVSKGAKRMSLILLWASLTISFVLIHTTVVRIILPLVGIGVSIHLLTLKTVPESAGIHSEADPASKPEAGR